MSDPNDIYSDLIDIGKEGRRDQVDQVVPYLTSDTDFLREAAIRTLVFHLRLPEHVPTAVRLLTEDPDEAVRSAAAMGLGHFATGDREILRLLPADVFALTAVLADRVSGHPFTGVGTTNAIAIMVGERAPWTGDPDLGGLIDAGLAPDPSLRIGLDELVARLEPLADRNPESAVIEWKRTGDGEFPYRATWRGKDIVLRVNDFPAEPLYTLLLGDEELKDLEDWPQRWVRPNTR